MKIDLTQAITDAFGKPIHVTDANGEPTEEVLTLKTMAMTACWNPLRGDENANEEQKTKAAMLAIKIAPLDVVDLSNKEIGILKDRINRAYPQPGLMTRAHMLLDPPADGEPGAAAEAAA